MSQLVNRIRIESDGLSYVDRPKSSSMPCSHVLVQSVHCLRSRHLSVLLVHVVCTGTRVVTNPDAEILDFSWALLVYLVIQA